MRTERATRHLSDSVSFVAPKKPSLSSRSLLCPISNLLSCSHGLDPVDYMSTCTLDHIASTMIWSGDTRNDYTTAMLRLDAGVEPSDTYGMPYTIVSSPPALLKLNFGQEEDYRDESDFYLSTGVKTTGDAEPTSQAYLRYETHSIQAHFARLEDILAFEWSSRDPFPHQMNPQRKSLSSTYCPHFSCEFLFDP